MNQPACRHNKLFNHGLPASLLSRINTPPFYWDKARRFALRCELDAAFFPLYGLMVAREAASGILKVVPFENSNYTHPLDGHLSKVKEADGSH